MPALTSNLRDLVSEDRVLSFLEPEFRASVCPPLVSEFEFEHLDPILEHRRRNVPSRRSMDKIVEQLRAVWMLKHCHIFEESSFKNGIL